MTGPRRNWTVKNDNTKNRASLCHKKISKFLPAPSEGGSTVRTKETAQKTIVLSHNEWLAYLDQPRH